MAEKNPELSVQSGAVDTHCHLFLMEVEPAVAVETARASGIERLICVGVDVETSRRSLEIADSLEGVFATAGVHPHDAQGFDPAASARIEELLHDPRVVAVGECGLDWFRMLSPKDEQIRRYQDAAAKQQAELDRDFRLRMFDLIAMLQQECDHVIQRRAIQLVREFAEFRIGMRTRVTHERPQQVALSPIALRDSFHDAAHERIGFVLRHGRRRKIAGRVAR